MNTMNTFELKRKLKAVYPDLKGNTITDIMDSTEFINTDIQALINNSVSFVKDLFTVQTIDRYAEKITTYTQEFLATLDKLKIHWLVCHLPIGLNFYSDENNCVFSESYAVRSEWASAYIKQLRREGKDKTFMIYSISESEGTTHIIRGILVRKSIFANLL